MAIYRLNRKEWDKGFRSLPLPSSKIESSAPINKKRKAVDDDNDDNMEVSEEEQGLKSKAEPKRKTLKNSQEVADGVSTLDY